MRPDYYGLVCHGVSRQLLPTNEITITGPYIPKGTVALDNHVTMSRSHLNINKCK